MATNLEEARGKDIVVRFDAQRFNHARHCVLGHPAVFQANVQGPWIDPEAASPERTAAVVQACPSGALSCERLDGGLQESPPLVNVIRIRENGPLAVVADLQIVNEAPMIRATLCRCGRSKNKRSFAIAPAWQWVLRHRGSHHQMALLRWRTVAVCVSSCR